MNSNPTDADLPPNADLGNCLESFRASKGEAAAGFLLSLLLMCGGLTFVGFVVREVYRAGGSLPLDAKQGMSWLAAGLLTLLGLGMLVGGASLWRFSRSLISLRIEFCEHGIRHVDGPVLTVVNWEQIDSIRETVLYERPPLLKGPARLLLPKFVSRSYTLSSRDQYEFHYSRSTVKNLKRLSERLRSVASQRNIPWHIVEEHAR